MFYLIISTPFVLNDISHCSHIFTSNCNSWHARQGQSEWKVGFHRLTSLNKKKDWKLQPSMKMIESIQTHPAKLIFLLLYLPLLLCSWGPGAVAGRHFNCVVGRDEKGIHMGRYILVCMCVRTVPRDNWRGTPGHWSPLNPAPLPFKLTLPTLGAYFVYVCVLCGTSSSQQLYVCWG